MARRPAVALVGPMVDLALVGAVVAATTGRVRRVGNFTSADVRGAAGRHSTLDQRSELAVGATVAG